MRPRSIYSLASLPEPQFLQELTTGLELISEHVHELELAVNTLTVSKRWRGSEAIRVFADEEAAKFLILLDAVRCDRRHQLRRSTQLKRFNQHLAKGIYANVCEMRPASYDELLRFIGQLRQRYYLDGPNDVDWIFRNEIEASREEHLYVDYVQSDQGSQWQSPQMYDDVISGFSMAPSSAVVQLVAAMVRAGLSTAAGLENVASTWRSFDPRPNMPWSEVATRIHDTLVILYDAKLMASDFSQNDERVIKENWTFPLHGADLSPIDVDPEMLREQQRNWYPDF